MKLYPFTDIVTDVTSKFKKIKASNYKASGQFKIIDQGQGDVAGYTDDRNIVNFKLSPIIIFGDHTRIIKYEDTPIALGADGTKALKVDAKLANTLYIYYYLRSVRIKDAGYSRHFKFLKEIKIPIPQDEDEPSLDDQIRIVNVLRRVERLIAKRKKSLKYIDDLIKSVFWEMFGDPVLNEKGWERLSFNNVGHFVSGGTPSKSREEFWSGTFPWVSPKDMKLDFIQDSQDHISELVFEETSLKKIPPFHLLIVVRGLILAHSFPIAINIVEVAINQDMKAIKPIDGLNVIYLRHCLDSLKRQVLKLISTAGHGTRKFDSIAMQKLFIPIPPPGLQSQFVTIVEKVESIKSRYQQNLTELENLYGALSQKAFKGELDLSRVPLPTEADEATPTIEEPFPQVSQALESPDIDLLQDSTEFKNRKHALRQWLAVFIENSTPGENVSIQEFMTRTLGNLLELSSEGMFEELGIDGEDELTTSDYDFVKSTVFKMLEDGSLLQKFDEDSNTIRIVRA